MLFTIVTKILEISAYKTSHKIFVQNDDAKYFIEKNAKPGRLPIISGRIVITTDIPRNILDDLMGQEVKIIVDLLHYKDINYLKAKQINLL